ncbi:MAG TPA: DUF308 domain-containing protein, partial [Nitrososphaeraceae archaeon]|nr:DUF308 domain-containing protein [Nitrososphaeraceae archaeon]
MSYLKAPGWSRAAQVGLGAVAITLSILILIFPGIAIVSIVLIIGVLLLIVGIESVIIGLFVKRWMASIGLGILVIILALIVLAFPVGTTVFLILLMGIALLIDG